MTIFDIAPLSAWRTLYKIAKSSINNGTAPTQMRAILKADLLTWQLRRPCTHRNGETQLPTVPGAYWFRGRRFHNWSDAQSGEWFTDGGSLLSVDSGGNIVPYGSYWTCGNCVSAEGQWWGPVMAPWEIKNAE